MCYSSDLLDKLITVSKVERKSAYTTGEVGKIISVTPRAVVSICDDWMPGIVGGLESYRAGTHRRIPHHALIAWLKTSSGIKG